MSARSASQFHRCTRCSGGRVRLVARSAGDRGEGRGAGGWGPPGYAAGPGEGRLALVWAPAVEHGSAPALPPEPPLTLNARDRLLVLAPHPDDEIVSNGGLILAARAAGAAVRIVWATDGGRNPWAQVAHERRWPVGTGDPGRWGAPRPGAA